MAGNVVAEISGAVKRYGQRNVVDGVDMRLSAGRTTVLVGPNGCGKTTTMEMFVGLRSMTAGTAQICGTPVRPGGPHRPLVGVQLQSSGLPSRIRVKEAIDAVSCLFREPADWQPIAEALGLTDHLRASVDTLSGGQRRRLDVLTACLGRPRFLVLDEPTSGVDPEGRADLWDFVRSMSAQGTAVLASTHDMAEAEAFADELLVMAHGRIRAAGSTDDVLSAAGGATRMRVVSLPADLVPILERSGLRTAHSGQTVVAIGESSAVQSARRDIEARLADRGEVRDILIGPVRLEDVFAALAGEGSAR